MTVDRNNIQTFFLEIKIEQFLMFIENDAHKVD